MTAESAILICAAVGVLGRKLPGRSVVIQVRQSSCFNAQLGLISVGIRNQQHHRLLLGVSDIAGFGCFTACDLQKGELIQVFALTPWCLCILPYLCLTRVAQEYCGEILSHEEADRRGGIYDRFNHSYLFNLR